MIWKPDDDALVKKLAALLEETGLSEIEVGRFWKRLRVARHKGVIAVSEPAAAPAGPAATSAAKPAAEIGPNHPGAVTAPMVGTVYVAAEPGAKPFVAVGDMVKKGQKMGIAGQTGFAGGVHVHFSMQVDGVQVNPREWWDEHWIRDRILAKLDPDKAAQIHTQVGAPRAPRGSKKKK